MNARLFVLSGADLGKSFALDAGMTLGRSPECAVPLRDASISRVHARVERRADAGAGSHGPASHGAELVLVDQQSRNGLWNKGARVPELALADLLEFKVGDVLVRVRLEPNIAEPAPAARPEPAPIARKASATLELEELEEIVLEDEPAAARVAAPAPQRPAEPPRIPESQRPASLSGAGPEAGASFAAPSTGSVRTAGAGFGPLAATKLSPALETRGQRVLQYHKTDGGGGVLSSDLEQRPWWFKLLVFLVALAVCAAVAWLAFSGTSFLRERAQSDAPAGSAESTRAADEPAR